MPHNIYKIEIDLKESPQQPIIYFRKERKCKTSKGHDRQHERIVNEAVNDWRQFDQQWSLLTVSRVPSGVLTPVGLA